MPPLSTTSTRTIWVNTKNNDRHYTEKGASLKHPFLVSFTGFVLAGRQPAPLSAIFPETDQRTIGFLQYIHTFLHIRRTDHHACRVAF